MSSHIEYYRFPKGESCVEEGCRARKFYLEDGKKFCQRGHEETGFRQTQRDDDDFNNLGKKHKRIAKDEGHVKEALAGSDAIELYLQCYQLILWKQIYWLVTVKGFPKELETVIRDLWDLRLRVLQGRPEERSVYGTEFGSTTEGETTDTDATGFKSMATSIMSRKRAARSKENLPKLIETLGVCYLGMLLLRLPTSLGEIFRWATRDEIVYTRAIKEIPNEMRARLPAHYYSALEIHTTFNGYRLHHTVLEMITFYKINFEMVFPPLNHKLLLYKHVRNLGLPVDIYMAVNRLAALLAYDFSYPIHNTRLYGTRGYPELQLMSLIVIATKLSHPFDDLSRLPESDLGATVTKLNWAEWRHIMTEETVEGLKRGDEIKITDSDVLKMTDKQMDDWMDWYQKTWVDDQDQKMPRQILELFPLPGPPVTNTEIEDADPIARVKDVHKSMAILNPMISRSGPENKDDIKPGEMYRRYRRLQELPEDAKAFYEIVACNIGISVARLIRGVFLTEIQLEKWMLAERKKGMMEAMDLMATED